MSAQRKLLRKQLLHHSSQLSAGGPGAEAGHRKAGCSLAFLKQKESKIVALVKITFNKRLGLPMSPLDIRNSVIG